jgi:hypothetical protein
LRRRRRIRRECGYATLLEDANGSPTDAQPAFVEENSRG